MKNVIYTLLLALMMGANVFAQEINYYNKSWAEIKAKAKAENKYIMVDAYTDWCGWCKVMDKETMKDAKVVDFLNKNFVPVKMEMEHGEGTLMAMKYHISAFPTFMFFNPAGEYVYTAMGYRQTPAFMEELNNSMNKNKQFASPGFSVDLEPGFPKFYKDAYAENGKREFPKTDDVIAFLDKQSDLFSEVSWGVLAHFDAGEKYKRHFLENMSRYEKLYGTGTVSGKLDIILYGDLQRATKAKDESKLNDVLALVDKYVKEDAADKKISFKINYYTETKEWTKLTNAIDEFISRDKYKNVENINSMSWDLYEKCDDQPALKKATAWMAKVVQLEPKKYAYLDTYAALLYKTKQLHEAEIWANKAIEEGEKSGEKTESTRELLEKVKKAR